MAFFSLRNSHTFFIIILAVIAIPVIVDYFQPEYLQDSGYVAILIIIAIVVMLPLNANIQGRGYPHITHLVFDPRTKSFYRGEDFFVDEEPRPTQLVLDVWPMKEDARGNAVPVNFGGRWWYPYIVKTRWPVSVAEFKDSMLHIFVLPHPWKKFLGFGRREAAAYLLGEEISHGSSTVLCSILAPFKRKFVGIDIPVYVGVLSAFTMLQISDGWEEAMNAWARLSQDIDKLLRDHKDEIFPQKQLDELLPTVYPELVAKDKKVVDLKKVEVAKN